MGLDFRLINGPVATARQHREKLVEAMARDIVRFDAIHTKSDAIRSLLGRYDYTDIALLVDDARAVAFQTIVEKVMSES